MPKPPPPKVLIDKRSGSIDLVKYSPLDEMGVLVTLEDGERNIGDVAIYGNGPPGIPTKSGQPGKIRVGIEVKSLSDFSSSLDSGRLQYAQVPPCLDYYDVFYVLVYGRWKSDYRGNVVYWSEKASLPTGRWRPFKPGGNTVKYAKIEGALCTLEACGVRRAPTCETVEDAARWIGELAKWWSKPWADHKTMWKFYRPAHPPLPPKMTNGERQTFETLVSFPSLGFKRALAAAQHFGSLWDALVASPKDWATVEGIGEGTGNYVIDSAGVPPEARAHFAYKRRVREATKDGE